MTVGRVEFEKKLKKHGIRGKDFHLIMMTYEFAKYGHLNQLRDDGITRYFEHPKEAALILIDELKIYDPSLIIVLLLHDIKEESFILGWWAIEYIFGKKIRRAIRTLTKDRALLESGKAEKEAEYYRRLLKATKFEKLAKLIDRLHNIRHVECWEPEKIKVYIGKTENILLPVAREVNEYLYQEIKKICEKYTNKELP